MNVFIAINTHNVGNKSRFILSQVKVARFSFGTDLCSLGDRIVGAVATLCAVTGCVDKQLTFETSH